MELTASIDYAWQADAVCHDQPPSVFFPHAGQDHTRALALCATCPVQAECLSTALLIGPDCKGIWGGTNERQRRRLRVTDLAADRAQRPISHGTAGYRTHLRRGETPCDVCRAAVNAKAAVYRANRVAV